MNIGGPPLHSFMGGPVNKPPQSVALPAALSHPVQVPLRVRTDVLIYCHLCLIPVHSDPVVHRRKPSNQEPAFRSQDHTPPGTPLSLLGEGSQDEHLASCLLGHLAGRGACRVTGLLLKQQALGVSCCLIYIKGRIKFS